MKICPQCEKANIDQSTKCAHCGEDLVEETTMQSSNETAEISEQPPKKHVKKWIFLCIALILAAIIVVFVVVGIPAIQYQTACDELTAGNYSSARTIFESLSDYKDSHDLLKEVDYLEAKSIAASDLLSGLDALTDLGDYKDTQQLVEQQKALILDKAKELTNQKDFDAATTHLDAIPEYEGVETQRKEIIYQQALQYEKRCEYGNSKREFSKIKGYKDVNTQLDKLVYKLVGNTYRHYDISSSYGVGKSIMFQSNYLYGYWLVSTNIVGNRDLDMEYFYKIEDNTIYGYIRTDETTELPSYIDSSIDLYEIGKIHDIEKDSNGNIKRIKISGLLGDEAEWYTKD